MLAKVLSRVSPSEEGPYELCSLFVGDFGMIFTKFWWDVDMYMYYLGCGRMWT